MKKALIVGGNSGIGLAICKKLLYEYDHLYIVGKDDICIAALPNSMIQDIEEKTSFYKINFVNERKQDCGGFRQKRACCTCPPHL